jgi:Transposase IS116/IS110/IS902 family
VSGSSGSAPCSNHHGLPRRSDLDLLTAAGRDWLTELSLSPAAREQITIALRMIGALDTEIPAIDKQLRACARRQTGCRALMSHYGIGELTSVAILAELGDCRRFSSSRCAVRYGGLDITVHASDRRRAPGHLSRQGPPVLRWALYEAAQAATRPSSPDHDYYRQAAQRLGHTAPVSRSHATSSNAATTPSKTSATRRSRPHETSCAPRPTSADAPRPAPRILLPPRPRGRPPKTERPHGNFPQREPHHHHVADPR